MTAHEHTISYDDGRHIYLNGRIPSPSMTGSGLPVTGALVSATYKGVEVQTPFEIRAAEEWPAIAEQVEVWLRQEWPWSTR
jgi:hypothetical protein